MSLTPEQIAWLYTKGGYRAIPFLLQQPDLIERGWTETPLYGPEALAERDAELERLKSIVQGWHYFAVGPDEMGDYYTQKQLIKASEPYASPALKALGETK